MDEEIKALETIKEYCLSHDCRDCEIEIVLNCQPQAGECLLPASWDLGDVK